MMGGDFLTVRYSFPFLVFQGFASREAMCVSHWRAHELWNNSGVGLK